MSDQTHQPKTDKQEKLLTNTQETPSSDETNLLSPILTHVLQRPSAQLITPNVVNQLQRRYGNRFTHRLVMQAQSKQPTLRRIQRDLATPPPETAPRPQADLSQRQIQQAIAFNNERFSRRHTRTIQDIIGTQETGRFNADDIQAIADIQEEYGLHKDGKIGTEMFRFLNREMRLEGLDLSDDNCLVSFAVIGPDPIQGGSTVNPDGTKNIQIRGHFRIEARFQERCDCSQFEYRQFIQGTATLQRGALGSQDISNFWHYIPGGRLPASFQEDGNTTWAVVHYGHRDQNGQPTTDATNAENHYINADGTENQASGCIYRAEDFPGVIINNVRTGDILNIQINFRGEIRRNGRVIQTRRWTAINLQNFILN